MDFQLLPDWYIAHRWYGGLLVALLGLCIGSFLNICVYRIPNKLSIRTPAPHCPECKAPLTLPEIIPLVSWLFFGGRCRHCGRPIRPRYLAVELITAALFLACWWRLPALRLLVPALALTSVLVAAAFIDAEHTIIPNGLVLFGAVSGAVCVVVTGHPTPRDAALGVLAGGAPLMAIDVVSRLVFRKDGMGGGDVKLMAMAGIFLGWQAALVALLLAVAAGGLMSIALLVARRMKPGDYFPFGPFLAAGSIASLLFFADLVRLYGAFSQALVGWVAG